MASMEVLKFFAASDPAMGSLGGAVDFGDAGAPRVTNKDRVVAVGRETSTTTTSTTRTRRTTTVYTVTRTSTVALAEPEVESSFAANMWFFFVSLVLVGGCTGILCLATRVRNTRRAQYLREHGREDYLKQMRPIHIYIYI